MKVLVTGAAGFIGSSIVSALLKKGHSVRVLSRKPVGNREVECLLGDIRNREGVKGCAGGVDVVIHAAAARYHYMGRREIYETNVTGTRNLLESSRNVKHFIHISTYLTLNPTDDYSRSKKKSEDLVEKSGIKSTILLLGPVFGPKDNTNISRLIKEVARRRFIPVFGSGKQIVHPVFVEDVARAVVGVAENRTAGKYLLAGEAVTVNGLIDLASEALHARTVKLHIPIPIAYVAALVLEKASSRPAITRNQIRNIGKSVDLSGRSIRFMKTDSREAILLTAGKA